MATIHESSPSPSIAAYDHFRSTYVFYAGQPVRKIETAAEVRQFFKTGADAYLIVRESDLEKLADALPADISVIARRPRFLKSGHVLALGR